jgi:hypothetical protein
LDIGFSWFFAIIAFYGIGWIWFSWSSVGFWIRSWFFAIIAFYSIGWIWFFSVFCRIWMLVGLFKDLDSVLVF